MPTPVPRPPKLPQEYFGGYSFGHVHIPGRTHPVETLFLEDALEVASHKTAAHLLQRKANTAKVPGVPELLSVVGSHVVRHPAAEHQCIAESEDGDDEAASDASAEPNGSEESDAAASGASGKKAASSGGGGRPGSQAVEEQPGGESSAEGAAAHAQQLWNKLQGLKENEWHAGYLYHPQVEAWQRFEEFDLFAPEQNQRLCQSGKRCWRGVQRPPPPATIYLTAIRRNCKTQDFVGYSWHAAALTHAWLDSKDAPVGTSPPLEANLRLAADVVEHICRKGREGAVLVFVPGWKEMCRLHDMLAKGTVTGEPACWRLLLDCVSCWDVFNQFRNICICLACCRVGHMAEVAKQPCTLINHGRVLYGCFSPCCCWPHRACNKLQCATYYGSACRSRRAGSPEVALVLPLHSLLTSFLLFVVSNLSLKHTIPL